jgi:hypothetical protein
MCFRPSARLSLRLVATGLLMAAFAGGPVWAQSAAAFALRGKFTTPSLTATRNPDPTPVKGAAPNLRGPLDAVADAAPTAAAVDIDASAPVQTQTPAPRPLATPAFTPLPAPGSAFAGGFPAAAPGGFAASLLPSLPSFRSGSDPAPVCRTECSKTRTLCAGNDDGECDSQWAQCIASCSSSALR